MIRQTICILFDSEINVNLLIFLANTRTVRLNTEILMLSILLALKLLKYFLMFLLY